MSKIGKINISIPEKVKVLVTGNIVMLKLRLYKKAIQLQKEKF